MKEQNINLTIKPFGPRNGEYYSSVLILIKDIYGNNIFERKKIIESSLQELNIDVTFSGLVYISVQNDKNILYTCKAFKL